MQLLEMKTKKPNTNDADEKNNNDLCDNRVDESDNPQMSQHSLFPN